MNDTEKNATASKASKPKRPFYVTTPIYYVNAAPHLGTAYTTLAADTLARYERMNNCDVAFVTGLDEHGQKVAETAEANGMTPQEWCDSMVPAFTSAWDDLGIEYTKFVRTSSEAQTRTVQMFWNDLYERGYLYKSAYEGWYCVHEETYYAESDLEKNNQGEYVCPDCKRPVRHMASGEENWFFKLSEFQEPLLKFYAEHPEFIRPETRRNEVVSFVERGLQDLSISRSTFDWGVPLPFDEGHVCYVWADALLAYLTGIGYGADGAKSTDAKLKADAGGSASKAHGATTSADVAGNDENEAHGVQAIDGNFDRFWPAQYHFVGKDITRFHCVIWPAMLMAANLPIPRTVFGHGFLLTKGEKMSKSRGNGVMPADLVRVFGLDAYRYYFMSDVQFGNDGDISLERMVQVYNADLANTWGNLVSRVFNMTGKYFDGRVPSVERNADAVANPLREIAEHLYGTYNERMEQVDFTGAAKAVMELAHAANLYVEEQAPWNLAKSENTREQLAQVMYNLLESIRIIALYLAPFMPNASAEVFKRLSLGDVCEVENIEQASKWGGLPSGNAVTTGEPLFPRLPKPEEIELDLG